MVGLSLGHRLSLACVVCLAPMADGERTKELAAFVGCASLTELIAQGYCPACMGKTFQPESKRMQNRLAKWIKSRVEDG